MTDVLPSLAVVVVGVLLLGAVQRGHARSERTLLTVAWLAHVGASFVQVWVTRFYYRGGDMFVYHRTGIAVADLLRLDFVRFGPEVLDLVFHREAVLPIGVYQGATGAMVGISGGLCFVLGDSIYAVCLALSTAALAGQYAMYRVFRESFEARLHPRLLLATMLVPSLVFWTSGLLKETVAVSGFGFALFGLQRLLSGKGRERVAGAVTLFVGAVVVGVVKPYILMTFAMASAVFWFWARTQRLEGSSDVLVRPLYLVLGVVGALGLVVAVGSLFPRYSLENLALETSQLQQIGTRVDGGSNYTLSAPAGAGPLVQLAYAPLALGTSLFRPFLFEASSPPVIVNALETTFLTALLVRALWRHRWRALWVHTRRSPLLMACLTFVLTFGVAVGLASTNLGSLSRYRAPMMPLLAALILLWDAIPMPARAPARPRRRAPARRPRRPYVPQESR